MDLKQKQCDCTDKCLGYLTKNCTRKEDQRRLLFNIMRGDEELGLYDELKKDWFCPKCDSYVSSESVTFEETHQTCNTGVVIKEPKQETTLDEAANRYFPFAEKIGGETYIAYKGFKNGAEWQSERMYSEEDMIEYADYSWNFSNNNRYINPLSPRDWFKERKK